MKPLQTYAHTLLRTLTLTVHTCRGVCTTIVHMPYAYFNPWYIICLLIEGLRSKSVIKRTALILRKSRLKFALRYVQISVMKKFFF